MTIARTSCRSAFTLVEMLVATALIIFVLVILTSVFTTGIGALRTLRGVGHMQDHLRYAVSTLREDLARPHFGKETDGLRGPNLSQQRLDLYDWSPPKEGFFRVVQLPEPNAAGGTMMMAVPDGPADGDGLTSTVATRHALHFTVRIEPNSAQGSGRDQFFFTNSLAQELAKNQKLIMPNWPPITSSYPLQPFRMRFSQNSSHINDPGWDLPTSAAPLFSPWAEVAYFLRPSGQVAGSQSLYTLHRRRRVLPDIKLAYRIPATVASNRTPYPSTAAPPEPADDADLMVPASGGLSPTTVPLSVRTTDVSLYDAKLPMFAAVGSPLFINTPENINVPFRRLGMEPISFNNPTKVPARSGLFETRPLSGAPDAMPTGFYKSIYEEFDPKVTGVNTASLKPGGDDILLENVLSFEIKLSWDIPTDSRINRSSLGVTAPTSFATASGAVLNPDYPFDFLRASPADAGNDTLRTMNNTVNNPAMLWARVFDTWRGEDYTLQSPHPPMVIPYSQWNNQYENGATASNAAFDPVTIPLRIRVKAIQIRLRVWDAKTQQARQVTIVQDL